MRNRHSRRWLTAALIAAVTLLSVPSFANDQVGPKGELGLFTWLQQSWTLVWSVLASGPAADPNGSGPAADPNGGSNAAAITPPGAAEQQSNGQ